MRKSGAIGLATGLLLGSSMFAQPMAQAEPAPGPYISLGAVLDYLQPENFHGPGSGTIGFDAGGGGSASAGYRLGNGIRVELQGDFASTKLNRGGSGNFQQYHGFANVLYDIDGGLAGAPWLSPYVGVGGGYGASHFSGAALAGGGLSGNPFALHTASTDENFAVQGIAGLSFDVGIPGLELTAEYRFQAAPADTNYNTQWLDANGDHSAVLHTQGLFNHVAMLGVRYALFSPPRAPLPPPAAAQIAPPQAPAPPEAARTYLVFFDWDRADLTPRARQIVAEAASASTKIALTRIDVNGFTDLSGTAAYNQRLSLRRAENVEAELVRDGVPKAEISVRGFGENNPLVATAKGVREPQNRRVEIILH